MPPILPMTHPTVFNFEDIIPPNPPFLGPTDGGYGQDILDPLDAMGLGDRYTITVPHSITPGAHRQARRIDRSQLTMPENEWIQHIVHAISVSLSVPVDNVIMQNLRSAFIQYWITRCIQRLTLRIENRQQTDTDHTIDLYQTLIQTLQGE